MKLFDWIKKTLGFDEDLFDDDFLEEYKDRPDAGDNVKDVMTSPSLKRENLNVLDYKERERFVRDHCEQMTSCSKDIDEQKLEYKVVMEHLEDIENIEALKGPELKKLQLKANNIISIEEAEKKYIRPVSKISESQYREMQRYEKEGVLPKALDRLSESETKQMRIRKDLNLLEGEKGALAFQKKEERNRAANAKTICFLMVFVSIAILLLLFFLHNTLRIDTRLGSIATLAVLSLGLTGVFVIYGNAQKSQVRAEKKLNRAIVLQNKAKVKYVNAANLTDYYYSKYKVNSSHELRYMWEKYLEEKSARNHSEEVAKAMEKARMDLLAALRKNGVKEPSVFVYQPSLLVESDELKELRHSLIVQRQRLKKGMDFNAFNLDRSKKEIEMLVRDYPQFAREILAIVSSYEG